jgi:hypothetical protein
VRSRAPLAPLLASAAISLSLLAGASGCKGEPPPAPTKIEEGQLDALKRPVQKEAANPDSGLKRPDLNPPTKSDGPQLAEAELEAALAKGQEFLAAGDEINAMGNFRLCANRDPASARCDGELGLIMEKQKRYRATGVYYLERAGGNDDPKASADLYARLGDKLRKNGKLELSAATWALAIAREDKAEHHAGRSAPLQSIPARIEEAADELAKARALDDRDQWMFDEGLVRGMIRTPEQNELALKLLGDLAKRTKDDALKKRADEAAATLRQSIAMQGTLKERQEKAAKMAADKAPAKEGEAKAPVPQ